MPKLSIVIVSYNVKYYVAQCITSVLRSQGGVDADITVVDNHSQDGTVEFLRKRFPSVKVVASNHNLGFARANNIAIKATTGEYVLLLSPDTIVGEDVLSACLSFMDSHPHCGGLGLRMLNVNGEVAMESRRGLPTPMTSFYKMTGLCSRFPKSRRFGRYYLGFLPWDEPVRIDVISGAFCMLRREALDSIGLLDEDFFMYGEDIDLSYRLCKGGYENWYIPSTILHYKGESTHKSSFRYVHVFYEAMLIFFRKHYGHMSLLLSFPIKAAICLKAAGALLQIQADMVRRSLGFVGRNRRKMPCYVFYGTGSSLEACRDIAASHGLQARFVSAGADTLPDGHVRDIHGRPDILTYAVYDTTVYSYAHIIRLFASHPMDNVEMGFFYPDDGVIITKEEVIR